MRTIENGKGGESLNFAIPINDAKQLILDGEDRALAHSMGSVNAGFISWPNERRTESVKTEHEEHAEHASLLQQKMCTDQAKKFFGDHGGFKVSKIPERAPFYDNNTFTSHYDAKTSVCYALIFIDDRFIIDKDVAEYWQQRNQKILDNMRADASLMSYEVYDALEDRKVGHIYYKFGDSDNAHTHLCYVTPVDGKDVYCETKKDFFSLIKKHFGLEEPY
jgi:hypothetical protein